MRTKKEIKILLFLYELRESLQQNIIKNKTEIIATIDTFLADNARKGK